MRPCLICNLNNNKLKRIFKKVRGKTHPPFSDDQRIVPVITYRRVQAAPAVCIAQQVFEAEVIVTLFTNDSAEAVQLQRVGGDLKSRQ